MKKYTVTIGNEVREYKENTLLFEIADEFAGNYENDIILAYADGKLRELFKPIYKDCRLEFVTTADKAGHKTYIRGLILVMLRAMRRVFENTSDYKVYVEYAIGDGIYCEVEGIELDESKIAEVKKVMEELVAENLPFRKYSVETTKAIELFHKAHLYDKEKLLGFRRVSKTNIYDLDGYIDYFYGYMPPFTGMLKYFDLLPYENGVVLMAPNTGNTKELKEFEPRKQLFKTLSESNNWGKTMGISTVADLNSEITKGNISDIILVQEALTEKKIADIARQIKEKGGRKFIMIAGPSSSGKTTFSHRLSIQLKTLGFKPHPIAVDDYFVDREATPLDENGNYNFESIHAIDTEQFNKDMMALLEGKRVELPTFNFKLGRREYKGNYKQLDEEDVLVIEGIHCLNDELSYSLPESSKYKIYISALTQLNVDEHNRIATTDGRLIRRIVRDARTRGTSAQQTIAMWNSVRRGEEENIFPFQEKADCMINSAMIYELAVLKQYAEPLLFGISTDCPEYQEAKRLLKFFDYFLGVSSEDIPKNSIIREFIGGSCFKV